MLESKLLNNFIWLLCAFSIIHKEVTKTKKLEKHEKCQKKINLSDSCRGNKSEESDKINKYLLLKSLKRIKFPVGTF